MRGGLHSWGHGEKILAPCVSYSFTVSSLSAGRSVPVSPAFHPPGTFAPTKTALPSQTDGPTSWKDTGASSPAASEKLTLISVLGSTPAIYAKNSNSFSGRSLYVEKHMQIELKMPWVSVSTRCQRLFLPLSDFPGVSMGLEWSGNWGGEGSGIRGETSLLGSVTPTTRSLSPHIVHWSRRSRAGSFASFLLFPHRRCRRRRHRHD